MLEFSLGVGLYFKLQALTFFHESKELPGIYSQSAGVVADAKSIKCKSNHCSRQAGNCKNKHSPVRIQCR